MLTLAYLCSGITRLRKEVKTSTSEILEVLNLIVDSYCFKNKNVEHMDFLKVTLQRKFEAANARNLRMATLVEDVWWEQLFGIHYLLKFNRSMVKNQVRLLTSLTADLRSLSHAMKLEQYEQLHIQYMKTLQREIYIIQLRSGDLLDEICEGVNNSVERKCVSLDLDGPQTLTYQPFFLCDRLGAQVASPSRNADGEHVAPLSLDSEPYAAHEESHSPGSRWECAAEPVPVLAQLVLQYAD